MEYKIESIPLSKKLSNKFPFEQMEVNQSFAIEDEVAFFRCTTAASHYGKRHNKKFSVTRSTGEFRCWRIK